MDNERIQIQVTEYSCAYCGQQVDPAHPEDHMMVCTKNPAARYKRALESLLLQIEEIVEGPEVGEQTRDRLLKAVEAARLAAFPGAVPASGQEDRK